VVQEVPDVARAVVVIIRDGVLIGALHLRAHVSSLGLQGLISGLRRAQNIPLFGMKDFWDLFMIFRKLETGVLRKLLYLWL